MIQIAVCVGGRKRRALRKLARVQEALPQSLKKNVRRACHCAYLYIFAATLCVNCKARFADSLIINT